MAHSQVEEVKTGLLPNRAQDVMQSIRSGEMIFAITMKKVDDVAVPDLK